LVGASSAGPVASAAETIEVEIKARRRVDRQQAADKRIDNPD
jgi:hypothetical protein